MKYEIQTVTLHPPIRVEAGESVETLMCADGRVMVVVLPDRVGVYVRRTDGDFVFQTLVDLTAEG